MHRDLKPIKVVLRDDGSYVLVDFGAVAESLVRRGSSTIVGTVGYMAPEQLQGHAAPASDVYAVGATALAALTGADHEDAPASGASDRRARRRSRGVRGTIWSRRSNECSSPIRTLRASSVGAALEAASSVSSVSTASPGGAAGGALSPVLQLTEDAVVKSLRRLLWTLWGIGWVIAPIIFGVLLNKPELIPVVMFGWLAGNVIFWDGTRGRCCGCSCGNGTHPRFPRPRRRRARRSERRR